MTATGTPSPRTAPTAAVPRTRKAEGDDRDGAADRGRGAGARVPEHLGGHDRQQGDDGLHGQDGAAQALHESSPRVNECLAGVPGSGARGLALRPTALAGASSSCASPAVTTEPVTSTADEPGSPRPAASASSASETARSMASSSRSRDVHPVLAEDVAGQLGQLVDGHRAGRGVRGHHDLGEDRLELVEQAGHVLVLGDGDDADDPVEVERLGQRLRRSRPCRPDCARRRRSPSASAAGCRAGRAS